MKRKDDTALPLEERMEEWMAGISARVREMDGKCREMLESLPEIPVNLDGYTLDEVEKVMDEECRRLSLCSRKGMSRREWNALEKEIQTRRAGFWKEYVMMCDSDYDCAYLFGILRFKLRWMVFYWENFGHGDEGDGTLSQMRLAVRLLDIVRRHGLDGPLPACPHGCTPAHLPAHLSACSSTCLFTHLPVHRRQSLFSNRRQQDVPLTALQRVNARASPFSKRAGASASSAQTSLWHYAMKTV